MNNSNSDLNYLIVKDNHGKKKIKNFLYRRVIMTFLLIALQIAVFILFLVKLNPYLEYYFGGSVVLSTVFMIYLSNCEGKNEFKIAWIVPLVLFPLFGVLAYVFFHTNPGGLKLKKKLSITKEKTKQFSKPKEQTEALLETYPEVKDLGVYLLNIGNYASHTNTLVHYFSEGEDFFHDFCNHLKHAKKYIFIEFFIIDVDESWIFILEILEQKIKEGVEVRVMYDAIGSIMASSKFYKKYLLEKGIKTEIFSPLIPIFVTNQNNRDHRKIAVIDGEYAYTGGLNLSNEYFNQGENRFPYWKDNALRLEGPAIANMTEMFLQNWNIWKKHEDDYAKYLQVEYQNHDSSGLVIPYGDDAFNNADLAEEVYMYIINHAKKCVKITTPYLVIDNQLQAALIFAAHRGIEVSIIVPNVPDHLVTFCIGKTYLKTLLENGVHIYLYNKGFIHAKTFISDEVIATVGSINLDYRSLYHHFECGTFLYKHSVIKNISEDFENTLKDCTEMKIEDYKKIPPLYRALGRATRIFGPLM